MCINQNDVNHIMSDNCRVSEALYAGLCRYVGPPTAVTVRREVLDMAEIIKKPIEVMSGCKLIESGSNREGFRFDTSDVDRMLWLLDHKLITDLSQASVYDLSKHTIILVEDSDTPPGFVILQLLTTPRDKNIASCIVPFNDSLYISNARWRQILLTTFDGKFNIKNHGPCASYTIGKLEHDNVFCFHCPYWSRLTYYWKKRCVQYSWPPNDLFQEIYKHGCHVVPIGSKISADENELEWRMSFSVAEQKLVYSMNHTQFLCYGLLKIFLREIVNQNIQEPFLCSYFLKTTMFWLIQAGHIKWCPNNLLECFWQCFKYLFHCVHRGVMSNFFIPQNNMFASKLATTEGVRSLEFLKEQLKSLYETGVFCLLQSSTIRSMIEPVLFNSYIRTEPVEISVAEIDFLIKFEVGRMNFGFKYKREFYTCIQSMLNLSQLSLSQYQSQILQKCFVKYIYENASLFLNTSPDCTNRTTYRSDRLISNLLKLAGKMGAVSDLLFLALHYYRTCRYRNALNVSNLVKSRILKPHIMYCTFNRAIYNEYVAGWPFSRRVKASADIILLQRDNRAFCIEELSLEQYVCNKYQLSVLSISPYVLADMLRVLCYYRLGDKRKCLESLTDLKRLLLYNIRQIFISNKQSDISWQILGICQHAVGDLHGAIQSYQVSLTKTPDNNIQKAGKLRMIVALSQLAVCFLISLVFELKYKRVVPIDLDLD